MNKIVTSGKRILKADCWHDDTGPLAGSPADWEPPMTDDEVVEAALSDPDAQPLTAAQLTQMRRIPLARFVRRRLGLSKADFAARFHIPVGTLRDWEQHRAEPDAATIAYLRVINADPEHVCRALAKASPLAPAAA